LMKASSAAAWRRLTPWPRKATRPATAHNHQFLSSKTAHADQSEELLMLPKSNVSALTATEPFRQELSQQASVLALLSTILLLSQFQFRLWTTPTLPLVTQLR
jgi:hypothetical protein